MAESGGSVHQTSSAHFMQGTELTVGQTAGVIVDASNELMVAFSSTPSAASATLPYIGDVTRARIVIDETRAPIDIGVTAVRRIDSRSSVTIMSFRAEQPLPSILREGSQNLRGEVRVSPRPGRAALVTMQAGTQAASGILLDVSMSGIGVLAEADAERQINNTHRVALETLLPGHDQPFTIGARVRNRRLRDDGKIVYGLRFITEEASPIPLTLVRYVLQRSKDA